MSPQQSILDNQHLFDKLTSIDYHKIGGNRYERTKPLEKSQIDDRKIEQRVREGLSKGPLKPVPTEETAPEEEYPKGVSPSQQIANWIQENLRIGNKVTWQQLFKRADAAFGGTQAGGAYSPDIAYSARSRNRPIADLKNCFESFFRKWSSEGVSRFDSFFGFFLVGSFLSLIVKVL